jgi:hypothetical protein
MLVIKIKFNRYFSHITFQLILHLVFTIAFGSVLSSGIPHKTKNDALLYLWGSVAFIYNLIASGCSVVGIIMIEVSLKKHFSEKNCRRALICLRISITISQIIFFFTCVALAVMVSKRDEFSEATKPLTDLSLAYTIIGIWYIILGTLYLLSGHCVMKNFSNTSSPNNYDEPRISEKV